MEVLRTLPSESIDCIITSPPYYGLRDYGTATWIGGKADCPHRYTKSMPGPNAIGGMRTQRMYHHAYKDICGLCGAKRVDRQIGLESGLNKYLNRLLKVTAELKRVLKKTGTMFWNHGDSYGGSGMGTWKSNSSPYEKCMMTQNYRLVIRMIDEQGWILRNQVIWHKSNVMPSSVKDRFTVDFEPVFFFVKSKKYWFERQYEAHVEPERGKGEKDSPNTKLQDGVARYGLDWGVRLYNPLGRNKRTVWKIPTQPFKEAHFATFPEKLIEPMIKAGCPESGIVLDPFIGSGTTAVVTKRLNRNYIGIELNSSYIEIAKKRILGVPDSLF